MIEENRFSGLFADENKAFSALIRNIGCLLSGELVEPILSDTSLVIEAGKISQIGEIKASDGKFDLIIDANGTTVFPGLIDSHVHPTIGQYSPRSDNSFWIMHCLHGGVTSMISAGEVHTPGKPVDRKGVAALAIAAQRCFENYRPGGVKVHAGAPLLENDLEEQDFKEMSEAGIKLVGEVGIGGVTDIDKAATMIGWARKYGMKSLTHTGGPSTPISRLISAEEILHIDPDVIGHINGGHTALPRKDIQCLCESCTRALEIVHNGNEYAALFALNLAKEMKQLDRIILGTDSPHGSGIPTTGILRLIALLSSFGQLPAEEVFCFATGNSAKTRDLDAGLIEEGRPADLVIADIAKGSEGKTLLESVGLGNLPGISMVLTDGKPALCPSQNTPPASRMAKVEYINPAKRFLFSE